MTFYMEKDKFVNQELIRGQITHRESTKISHIISLSSYTYGLH